MTQKKVGPRNDAAASRLRQDLRRELDTVAAIAERFFEREALVRGQVYETRRRCGKPTCHCAGGTGHPVTCLVLLTPTGRKNRALTPAARDALAPGAERYRRFREARAEYVRSTKRLLAVVDGLEDALSTEVDLDALKEAAS